MSSLCIAADAGSVYDPHPYLSLEWDPDQPHPTKQNEKHKRLMSSASIGPKGMELSNGLPSVLADAPSYFSEPNEKVSRSQSPGGNKEVIPGHEIWVYDGGTM